MMLVEDVSRLRLFVDLQNQKDEISREYDARVNTKTS